MGNALVPHARVNHCSWRPDCAAEQRRPAVGEPGSCELQQLAMHCSLARSWIAVELIEQRGV